MELESTVQRADSLGPFGRRDLDRFSLTSMDQLDFERLFGVLADHEPTMAALATGAVAIHGEDENVSVGIHGGFLQIYRNQVTLLTDRAEITEGGREDAHRLAIELRAAEESEGTEA